MFEKFNLNEDMERRYGTAPEFPEVVSQQKGENIKLYLFIGIESLSIPKDEKVNKQRQR